VALVHADCQPKVEDSSTSSRISISLIRWSRWRDTRDFNGDGKSDILWRDASSNTVAIWQMNGLQIVKGYSVGMVPGNRLIAQTGKFTFIWSDILWRDSNTGMVVMWHFNTFGQVSAGECRRSRNRLADPIVRLRVRGESIALIWPPSTFPKALTLPMIGRHRIWQSSSLLRPIRNQASQRPNISVLRRRTSP
jgi:hypothetical protein